MQVGAGGMGGQGYACVLCAVSLSVLSACALELSPVCVSTDPSEASPAAMIAPAALLLFPSVSSLAITTCILFVPVE